MRTAKTLIRLGGRPGWSESSLGTHSLYWFCHVAAHFNWRVELSADNYICNQRKWCGCRRWYILRIFIGNEPQHDKTKRMTCAPMCGSAWASTQADQSSLSVWRNIWSLAILRVHTEDYDQTGQMHRLIWVFAGRTSHFVGFVMWRLKCMKLSRGATKPTKWRFNDLKAWSELSLCAFWVANKSVSGGQRKVFDGRTFHFVIFTGQASAHVWIIILKIQKTAHIYGRPGRTFNFITSYS